MGNRDHSRFGHHGGFNGPLLPDEGINSMSRVHDALRKAAQENQQPPKPSVSRAEVAARLASAPASQSEAPLPSAEAPAVSDGNPPMSSAESQPALNQRFVDVASDIEELDEIIARASQVPYNPLKQALLVNP